MSRTATIENISHLRSDGLNFAVRCYGNKGWYSHRGVPQLCRTQERAEEIRAEFLAD